MSRILSIGTANPPYAVPQSTILQFMQHAYVNETASRKLNVLFQSSGIRSRYSSVPDFDDGIHDNSLFNRNDQPGIEKRLQKFRENAIVLALNAISAAFKKADLHFKPQYITHLITVTCTGLHSP